MIFKQTIQKFSYLTSRNYIVWAATSCLIFLPLTMLVLIINAIYAGYYGAKDYLVIQDFKISFSYHTYKLAKANIEKMTVDD